MEDRLGYEGYVGTSHICAERTRNRLFEQMLRAV